MKSGELFDEISGRGIVAEWKKTRVRGLTHLGSPKTSGWSRTRANSGELFEQISGRGIEESVFE